MRGVKTDQCANRPASCKEILQPTIGEDSLDEVLTQPWIRQPAFFLDRQAWKPLEERGRKQSTALPLGHPCGAEDFDPLHSAAGRVLLEDVAAEILARQLLEAPVRPGVHVVGVIDARARRDHPETARGSHEPERFAGRTKSQLDLGADGNPVDEGTKNVGQEAVALVPAVKAHLLTKEAGRDADPEPWRVLHASAINSIAFPGFDPGSRCRRSERRRLSSPSAPGPAHRAARPPAPPRRLRRRAWRAP